MAQAFGRRHPDIFALKIHVQDVVVRERSRSVELNLLIIRPGDFNLTETALLTGPVGDPGVGFEVEETQPLVRAGPDFVAARLGGVDEVGSEAAVLIQIVVPVAAVVAAQAEVR